jgi:hypothetical protein
VIPRERVHEIMPIGLGAPSLNAKAAAMCDSGPLRDVADLPDAMLNGLRTARRAIESATSGSMWVRTLIHENSLGARAPAIVALGAQVFQDRSAQHDLVRGATIIAAMTLRRPRVVGLRDGAPMTASSLNSRSIRRTNPGTACRPRRSLSMNSARAGCGAMRVPCISAALEMFNTRDLSEAPHPSARSSAPISNDYRPNLFIGN